MTLKIIQIYHIGSLGCSSIVQCLLNIYKVLNSNPDQNIYTYIHIYVLMHIYIYVLTNSQRKIINIKLL